MSRLEQKELYKLLELPQEVREALNVYEANRTQDIPEVIYRKLLVRNEWGDGIKELQNYLGDDPMGMKILWELLHIVCQYSYEEYKKRGINEEIFVATMKFLTRSLYEHYATWGTFKCASAWWFPRQMSVQEFRIGALEYEFVDGKEREIAVHIPSDADMNTDSINSSMSDFEHFREIYFTEWKDVQLTCDSWMLMPELRDFLDDSSKIVAFQKRFQIDNVDREATWYMEWIYPGYDIVDEKLPEKTILQRKLKKFLLGGKKFGIAKGHIK